MPDASFHSARRPDAGSQAPRAAVSGDGIPDRRTDEDLVDAVRRGDAGAWGELARRTLPRIYGLCYRMLGQGVGGREAAADAAQATMLRLVQVLGRYDSRSRFSTWVYRVTTNVCISRMRSAKVRRAASLDQGGSASGGDAVASTLGAALSQSRELEPGLGVERTDRARRVREALEHLEPEQRVMLILRDGQDLSYEHIAQVLGISIGTVKSRLFRARSALREVFEATEQESVGPRPPAGR